MQIDVLRQRLLGLTGSIFFEFTIPRMGKRIDVVLLIGSVVFVVEFKVGATSFERAAFEQVWDYALDLENFHEASHHLAIVPILVATDARDHPRFEIKADSDGVYRPIAATPAVLRDAIDLVLPQASGEPIDAARWLGASYRPTPTIVEAARALYAQHSVESIARHDAGAENLRVTSQHVETLVADASERSVTAPVRA